MRLPALQDPGQQTTLWGDEHRTFRSIAQMRTFIGGFFEEATCTLTGGQRYSIDSSCVCPDLLIAPGIYGECKSVGRSNAGIVFQERVDKDKKILAMPGAKQLLYFFWMHHAAVKDVPNLKALRTILAALVHTVLVVDATVVHRICDRRDPVPLNHRGERGAGRFRPMLGWKLEPDLMRGWMQHQCGMIAGLSAYGIPIPMIPLHLVDVDPALFSNRYGPFLQ